MLRGPTHDATVVVALVLSGADPWKDPTFLEATFVKGALAQELLDRRMFHSRGPGGGVSLARCQIIGGARVMTGFPNAFGFHIHHIFPRDLYDDVDLRNAFNDLGINLDASGNKVALPNNAETAALFAINPAYAAAGFGTSVHRGRHPQYSNLIAQ